MKIRHPYALRMVVLISLMVNVTVLSSRMKADTGNCGGATITLPFTDVMGNIFFCPIAEAYFSGLTNGTTPTTYSPGVAVPREQMAAFITRTMDQSLKRGSRKAVAKKWWIPQDAARLTLTSVGSNPQSLEFDGTDLWVSNIATGNVMRIRPGDGKLLDTWTGATEAGGIAAAMGKIFITGITAPGSLYMIDPTQPAGVVATVSNSLGDGTRNVAFDGLRLWTANAGITGSVSIIPPPGSAPTTISAGFTNPLGILFDGASIWVTDPGADTLLRLNQDGSIAQTINVGDSPQNPVFDGTNIWVPNLDSNSVTVVRVKDSSGNPLATSFVLATLNGNSLNTPRSAAFDGERILVTNTAGDSVSLWKAADLTPLGSFPMGPITIPYATCSDGLNFWITLVGPNKVARF